MTRAGRLALIMAISAAMAACGSDARTHESPTIAPHEKATYEYVVPPGTRERLTAGEQIELMPQTLHATVGQSIFILNQDDSDHSVGPFFVAAGQSLAMTFNRAGVLQGVCELNPSGTFEIIVTG